MPNIQALSPSLGAMTAEQGYTAEHIHIHIDWQPNPEIDYHPAILAAHVIACCYPAVAIDTASGEVVGMVPETSLILISKN